METMVREVWTGCVFCLNPRHPGPCAKPGSKAYERRHGKAKDAPKGGGGGGGGPAAAPGAQREEALAQVPKVSRTAAESEAVSDYRSASWFKPMNNENRGNWSETEAHIASDANYLPRGVSSTGELRAGAQQRTGAIDGLMGRSKLKGDVETWRGVQSGDKMLGRKMGRDLTGTSWREDSFVSTTARKETAQEFGFASNGVLMRVRAPAGTGAVTVSGWSGEAEILLDRGQTMTVVKDHGVDPNWGYRVLDVDVS